MTVQHCPYRTKRVRRGWSCRRLEMSMNIAAAGIHIPQNTLQHGWGHWLDLLPGQLNLDEVFKHLHIVCLAWTQSIRHFLCCVFHERCLTSDPACINPKLDSDSTQYAGSPRTHSSILSLNAWSTTNSPLIKQLLRGVGGGTRHARMVYLAAVDMVESGRARMHKANLKTLSMCIASLPKSIA